MLFANRSALRHRQRADKACPLLESVKRAALVLCRAGVVCGTKFSTYPDTTVDSCTRQVQNNSQIFKFSA